MRFPVRGAIAISALLAFSAPVPHPTAVESVYFQVPGVKGPVNTASCTACIELFSYQWGASNPSGNAFAPAPLLILKNGDATSPIFSKYLAAGTPFTGTTKLEVVRPGTSQPYLVYQFNTMFVKSIQWSGPGDEGPQEEITFVYGGLEVCYTPQRGSSKCAKWK